MMFFRRILPPIFAVSPVITAPTSRKSKTIDEIALDTSAKAPSSTAVPEPIPVDWHLLAQGAGMAQQPYCLYTPDGLKVGDAEVVWSLPGGYTSQRVDIFKSKSLGIVASFQGTSPLDVLGALEDLSFLKVDTDEKFDPMMEPGAQVHNGFQISYGIVSDAVITGVKETLRKYNETQISVVGHSLGAAIGLLAALHFEKEIEGGVKHAYLYGLPRVGNLEFANSVDKHLKGKLLYTINGNDLISRVPPRSFGFQHPSGQIWIKHSNGNDWEFYPGQENVHGHLTVIPSPNTLANHVGVYYHTLLGWGPITCPATVNDQH